MCYDDTARPPLPPIAGGAQRAEGRAIELTAEDDNRFTAFSARTGSPGGPGIVILPDVRGLHQFYRELAIRFAEANVHATAFDYFGRTAGFGDRDDQFDSMKHAQLTQADWVALDTAAVVAHLRSPEGGGADRVFTVGFCFGGRHSFNQAARGHGLSGVIGLYGIPAPRSADDLNAPVLLASAYECPVLGLFGGADRAISSGDIAAFRQALDEAGVQNELVVYEGAPHSFFDRVYAQYQMQCKDAWDRMLRFIAGRG